MFILWGGRSQSADLCEEASVTGTRPVLLLGDAITRLKEMPARSVQTCVTSPPYWGLRDYGTAEWEGGDEGCVHKIPSYEQDPKRAGGDSGSSHTVRHNRESCKRCGAKRIDQQLGLEATPEEYVTNLVSVFREVRRVLRDDGTVWLNLGDSYFGGGRGSDAKMRGTIKGQPAYEAVKTAKPSWKDISGLKSKDLVGIPWRVAFALQADGWYLRSDIIWNKPNPMPEPVKDRPTKSHEYIFLLAKNRRYYYDCEAVKEPLKSTPQEYLRAGASVRANHQYGEVGGRPLGATSFTSVPSGRNARSVWTFTTQPYKDAHFATFPEALPERCIKAGSRPGDAVLDPFAGSGTTCAVAARLGRASIGIELNPEYLELAQKRCLHGSRSLYEFAEVLVC